MMMLVVDGNGITLNVEVESASTHEGYVAEQTVMGIKVKNIEHIVEVRKSEVEYRSRSG